MNHDHITAPLFSTKGAWRRLAILLAAAAVLALANGFLNPRAPEWTEARGAPGKDEVVLDAALASDKKILWIDARREADYAQSHIPGALPLNEDNWDERLPAVLSAWQPGRRVVVYCGSRQCQASREVAGRLRDETGLADVLVLRGGWVSWQTRAK